MDDMKKSVPFEAPILKIGIYEHYKSTIEDRKYYQVIGVAKHTETGEMLVVYLPLYETNEEANFKYFVRPLDMFTEDVEHNGAIMPRFQYVGTEL